jgi:hypothetical protein
MLAVTLALLESFDKRYHSIALLMISRMVNNTNWHSTQPSFSHISHHESSSPFESLTIHRGEFARQTTFLTYLETVSPQSGEIEVTFYRAFLTSRNL